MQSFLAIVMVDGAYQVVLKMDLDHFDQKVKPVGLEFQSHIKHSYSSIQLVPNRQLLLQNSHLSMD